MVLINTVKELTEKLAETKKKGLTIGLVPTMGALHNGHLSLINRARAENDIVVCSIFVNPVQFNNPEDLQKYPRTLNNDLNLINDKVDFVFSPTPEEVFPTPPTEQYDFGNLATVMEGAFRPGHFNGVAIIVKRLFDWVQPTKAYFGEKDFQQLVILKDLVKQYHLDLQIVDCPIVRESSGLALSSRNARLSAEDQKTAAKIHKILEESKSIGSVQDTKKYVISQIQNEPAFKLDYFAIVDSETLQPITSFDSVDHAIGCIALYISNVRLIDNVKYK